MLIRIPRFLVALLIFILPCFSALAHQAASPAGSRKVPTGPTNGRSGTENQATVKREMLEGIAAIQAGNLDAAREHFEKLIKLAPRNAEGHNFLGWVLYSQGQVDSSIGHFRTALQLRAKFPQAIENLANALAQKGNLEEGAYSPACCGDRARRS